TNPKRLIAYFLQGHREHRIDSDETFGFMKFAAVAHENLIETQPLSLVGTNTVPMDCNLLVIAGPQDEYQDFELEKIDQYLNQGGRLLALFNPASISRENGSEKTGMDKILAKWNVELGNNIIRDDERKVSGGEGMLVSDFNPKHPIVNPLLDSG